MLLKLYGAVSKILEPGAFAVCTPIFVNDVEKDSKFYRLDDNGQVIEIDLQQYGNAIFLPASRKKINDGKEYFIIYQSSKNATQYNRGTYVPSSIHICTNNELDWIADGLSMGIKFPDKFVCILKYKIMKEEPNNMNN